MKLEKNYRLVSYNMPISVAGVKKEHNLRSAETDWKNAFGIDMNLWRITELTQQL